MTGLLVCLVCGGSARADERWLAISTTAMAITGDALVAPGRIGFQAGAALMLRPAGTLRDAAMIGAHATASLFQVVPPSDPVLFHGNKLCGSGAVTYVAIWRSPGVGEDANGRSLAVFTGAALPRDGGAACAVYGFSAAGG